MVVVLEVAPPVVVPARVVQVDLAPALASALWESQRRQSAAAHPFVVVLLVFVVVVVVAVESVMAVEVASARSLSFSPRVSIGVRPSCRHGPIPSPTPSCASQSEHSTLHLRVSVGILRVS